MVMGTPTKTKESKYKSWQRRHDERVALLALVLPRLLVCVSRATHHDFPRDRVDLACPGLCEGPSSVGSAPVTS